jgi:uncharacterized protein
MSDEIDRLWTLHGLDEEAHGVRAALARYPELHRELERRVAEANERLERAKAHLGELQKQRRELERQAVALGEQERHFQAQLPAVKKNEEYTALLHEIGTTREKRSALETEILVRMEAEEQEQQSCPALERALATAREEAAARARVLEAEQAEAQARLDALEARRDASLQELPGPTRNRYERVHASRDGRAVVPIDKGACGGCFRTLPPAVLQEARRRDHVLNCDGCGRLMVWPPGPA